jgi:hypothetical protein
MKFLPVLLATSLLLAAEGRQLLQRPTLSQSHIAFSPDGSLPQAMG